MTTVWLCLFVLSVGGAFLMGYRYRPEEAPQKIDLHRDYMVGLNFLLNEETDKAVDIFIKMLEVDSDTVETHLAVGKLFRRRGEVDRAIRIHQNLIARPQLEKTYREQSLYELGQDYLSAGMLDRAERIFQELANDKSHAPAAYKTLLDIYQQAKDWEKAAETAIKYEGVTRQNMQPVIAQYYCELAELALHKQDHEKALAYLNQADVADKHCVRASLLRATVLMATGDYAKALVSLKKVKTQNVDYLYEAIDKMAVCYEALGEEDEMMLYLKDLAEAHPRVPVVLILADRIRKRMGDKLAAGFVADYVRRYPSLQGLYLFVNLYISSAEGRAKDDLHILQNLMKKILAKRDDYQCTSCGFSGKTLHWQCPGCRQWSSTLPLASLE
ncbi:MAG TPA: lipopolysaccharide assembly protein LapB [Gammaproteobacteria bacterium]|nr:lipopolysaccharide assembly protein LapB [Gammaproteobacteria bacterium]